MTKLGWIAAAGMSAALGLVAWQNHRLAERIASLSTALHDAPSPRGAPTSPPASCYLGPQFADQVAARLHELMPEATTASEGGGGGKPADPESEAREAERAHHAEVAHRKLDEILQRGRITADDVRGLAGELTGATSEEADKIRARIAAAVNRDQLVADDPRMLYP
jgi:hypothetical protein